MKLTNYFLSKGKLIASKSKALKLIETVKTFPEEIISVIKKYPI